MSLNNRVLGPNGDFVDANSVTSKDYESSPTVLKVELQELKIRFKETSRILEETKAAKDEINKSANSLHKKYNAALEVIKTLESENKKLAAKNVKK